MTVTVIIAADGHVIKCEIVSSDLGDKNFEREIAQGEESFDRPLNFHPIN